MGTNEKHLIWGKLLWILLWITLLGGIAYDIIWNQFINPLGILMLSILVIGTIISRVRKQPIITTKGYLPRTLFATALLVVAVGYILARIFIL